MPSKVFLSPLPPISLSIRLQHHGTANNGGNTSQQAVLAAHKARSVGAGGLGRAGSSLSSG